MKRYLVVWLVLGSLLTSCSANMKALLADSKPLYFENKVFEEPVDFTKLIDSHQVSYGLSQVDVASSITFKKCVFKKGIKAFDKSDKGIVATHFLSNLSFLNCQFEGDANFKNIVVLGKVDFSKSVFASDVNFQEAGFFQNAYFKNCVFKKGLKLQNSTFHQKAFFTDSEFIGVANFQSVLFNSDVQLSVCEFYEYAELTLLDCRGRLFCNYTKFFEKVDFSNSSFARNMYFVSTESNKVAFERCRFMEEFRFDKAVVTGGYIFQDNYFLYDRPEITFLKEKQE